MRRGRGLMRAGKCSTTLMREEEAKVGWRGLVVMVEWWGVPIMIVVEPLEVYHLQQELSTSMSYGQVCLSPGVPTVLDALREARVEEIRGWGWRVAGGGWGWGSGFGVTVYGVGFIRLAIVCG